MATMRTDELNIVSEVAITKSDRKVIPIAEYFRSMELPDEEIERRENLANIIFGVLAMVFTMIDASEITETEVDKNYFIDLIVRKLKDSYDKTLGQDVYDTRLQEFATAVVDTTLKNISDSYFLSDDRAILDAENESNLLCNDVYYQQAIKSGCTKKRWLTMRDNRVRHTHKEVDGEETSITQPFTVGNSQMLFPCDLSLGANMREIINCRCSCEYY